MNFQNKVDYFPKKYQLKADYTFSHGSWEFLSRDTKQAIKKMTIFKNFRDTSSRDTKQAQIKGVKIYELRHTTKIFFSFHFESYRGKMYKQYTEYNRSCIKYN